MRILFLEYRDPFNPYNGGGDIYLNKLARGLAKNGHKVTVISSEVNKKAEKLEIKNLKIFRMGNKFSMVLKIFIKYFTHLRGKFDLVIEEVIGGPRIPFFAAFYMKEPLIGIIQQKHKKIFQQEFSFPIAMFFSLIERFLVLKYRKNTIIVNSKRTMNDLEALGYYKDSMHVVYPGIPKRYLKFKNIDLQDRKSTIICLSKFRRYKLIHNSIIAFKEVSNRFMDLKLIIAGRTNEVDPDYEKEIRQLVVELNLEKRVQIKKDIKERDKIEFLRSSLALIQPSSIEGFGMVVIEANAFGTPVISSDIVPAAINKKNAIIFPYSDITSMTSAIIKLLTNKNLWKQLSKNSRKLANQFTWDNSIKKLIQIIENVNHQSGVINEN